MQTTEIIKLAVLLVATHCIAAVIGAMIWSIVTAASDAEDDRELLDLNHD